MKLKCPECSNEIEFDLNVTLKHKKCDFCDLTEAERSLLTCLVIVRGNISELQKRTGNSRSLIESEFVSIEKKLLGSMNLCESDSKKLFSKLDHETIRSVISHISGCTFSTFPDFINILQTFFPGVVKRYQEESPRNWRARIGRSLGEFCRNTGEIQKAGRARNTQIWEISERLTDGTNDKFGIGPQYKQDAPFAAQMRYHQSWFRSHILKLPYGTGPTPKSSSYYGNMLTRQDAAAGKNFLTPGIAHVARERVAKGTGAVETFRLFHNMLSSQPMCFNLFGPLVIDRALATRIIDALVPETVTEVTKVVIEWAPSPKKEYLDDRTAFDAFIEYHTVDGNLCALGIETKLTEPFSQKEYDGESYRRWMRHPASVWVSPTDPGVSNIRYNQLWRDHLLAFSVGHHPTSKYSESRLMVVRHPLDKECPTALAAYRKHLTKQDSLIDMPLDHLIDLFDNAVYSAEDRKWLKMFRLRYLELDRLSLPQK